MDKPKIELNGKEYEMKEPKGKAWRTFSELHEKRAEIPNVEFLERHAEVIAQNFDGLTTDDILEQMDISKIIPTFYECYRYIGSILYGVSEKLESIEGDGKTVGVEV